MPNSGQLQPAFVEQSSQGDALLLLLGRLDSKVDLLLQRDQQQDARISALEAERATIKDLKELVLRVGPLETGRATNIDLEALKARIEVNEAWRNRCLGISAAISVIGSAAWALLSGHIHLM